jgi:hypothetical protein
LRHFPETAALSLENSEHNEGKDETHEYAQIKDISLAVAVLMYEKKAVWIHL